MGKRDRRKSMKMNRRKAQVAKKERAKKRKVAKVTPEVAGKTKRTRAAKGAAPAPAAAAS
jgi:hypothetical protein